MADNDIVELKAGMSEMQTNVSWIKDSLGRIERNIDSINETHLSLGQTIGTLEGTTETIVTMMGWMVAGIGSTIVGVIGLFAVTLWDIRRRTIDHK